MKLKFHSIIEKMIEQICSNKIKKGKVLLWEGESKQNWDADTFELKDDYTNYDELIFIVNDIHAVKCFVDGIDILPGAQIEFATDGAINKTFRVWSADITSSKKITMNCYVTNLNGNGPEKVTKIYGINYIKY